MSLTWTLKCDMENTKYGQDLAISLHYYDIHGIVSEQSAYVD